MLWWLAFVNHALLTMLKVRVAYVQQNEHTARQVHQCCCYTMILPTAIQIISGNAIHMIQTVWRDGSDHNREMFDPLAGLHR